MAHPILTEKTTIEDMEIGDCIPCRYKAPVSGAVGEFSELGTCTASEIPKEGNVATPDGKFYFIKVDKGLLIADRVVQTNISWETLNNNGFIDGVNPIRHNFTKLSNPSTLPTGTGNGVAFDPTGTYMAVAHDSSPRITIYKRSGDTFTKLSNPSTLPTSTGNGVAFDPTGTYMAVAHSSSPYITIYKRNGDTFTKLSDPSTLPTSTGNGVAFDPTGTYMAVAHFDSPYITIYKRNGDTFTKLSNPSTLPTSTGNGVAFDPTGTYMAVAHDSSPYITIYKRNGDTFTKLSDPSTLPTGTGNGVAFDPTGTYMAVIHLNNPRITIYKRSGNTFDIGSRVRSLSGGVVYADANGNPTFTDSFQGAFPTSNEYDTYIKKSTLGGKIAAGDNNIWNYGKCFSLTKGAPVIGTWVNRGGVSAVTTNLQRMIRGNDNRTDGSTWMDVAQVAFDELGTHIGFRPVLEFIEPDSLQENAYY